MQIMAYPVRDDPCIRKGRSCTRSGTKRRIIIFRNSLIFPMCIRAPRGKSNRLCCPGYADRDFHLGVKPIFRRRIRLEKENTRQKVTITGECIGCGNAARSIWQMRCTGNTLSHRTGALPIAEIASSSVPQAVTKKFEVQYEWQRKTAAPARKEGRDNA